MFKHKHGQEPSYFDIRLASAYKGVVIVKGNELEVENVPLLGSVKLLLPEDIHVKKIKLNLVGTVRADFYRRDAAGEVVEIVCEDSNVVEVNWKNLLTNDEGELANGNYNDGLKKISNKWRPGQVPPPVSRPQNNRLKSASNLSLPTISSNSSSVSSAGSDSSGLVKIPNSGIDGTPFKNMKESSSRSFLLPKGNYLLPFSVTLPANIPETVESLKCGHCRYRLECTIERGRFEKSFNKSKYLRIFRTLHPQSLILTDSVEMSNTWPNKVQYLVAIDKKGLAVGSTIPVNITVVPLVKGLTLKAVNGSIAQRYLIKGSLGVSLPEFEDTIGVQKMEIGDPSVYGDDEWRIKTHFKVPDHLSVITQSCLLKQGIVTVKHRLRVAIHLHNKEGHTSELRTNLPITIYISANNGHVKADHYELDSHHNFSPVDHKEDVLFRHDDNRDGVSSNNLESGNDDNNDADREDLAPPLYQRHKFDIVIDSSLPQTPLEQFRTKSAQISPNGSSNDMKSYFEDHASNLNAMLLGQRVTSATSLNSTAPNSALNLAILSKLPSYEHALEEEDENGEELAPSYSGSNGSGSVSAGSTIPVRPILTKAHTSHPELHKKNRSFFKR